MKKDGSSKPLKFQVVEISRENLGLFDLESWLADMLVHYWLEINKGDASGSSQVPQEDVIELQDENLNTEEVQSGQ